MLAGSCCPSVSARRAARSGSKRGSPVTPLGDQESPSDCLTHTANSTVSASTAVTFRWSLPGESSLSHVPRLSLFGCRAAGAPQRAAGAPGRSDRPQPPAPVGAGQRRGLPDPVLHRAGARAARGTVADLLLVHQSRGHSLRSRKVPSTPGDPSPGTGAPPPGAPQPSAGSCPQGWSLRVHASSSIDTPCIGDRRLQGPPSLFPRSVLQTDCTAGWHTPGPRLTRQG